MWASHLKRDIQTTACSWALGTQTLRSLKSGTPQFGTPPDFAWLDSVRLDSKVQELPCQKWLCLGFSASCLDPERN
jgi:hypothetical protein